MKTLKKLAKEEKQEKIIEAFRKGYKVQPAIDLAGVPMGTYDTWINRNPSFAMRCRQAKAQYIEELIPEAQKKDPFKMLQAIYPEYATTPDTVINIDNRPLINAPSAQLMQILKENKGIASQDKEDKKELNSVSHGEVSKVDDSEE